MCIPIKFYGMSNQGTTRRASPKIHVLLKGPRSGKNTKRFIEKEFFFGGIKSFY